MSLVWTLCPGVSASRDEQPSGKRPGWPDEAGSALSLPKALIPPSLPKIIVNIARVGDIEALVDTGARYTTVQRDRVAHMTLQTLEPGQNTLIAAAGNVMCVVGWLKLAIRFKDRVVDVPVRVVERLVFPFILGIDWVDVVGAMVYSECGVGMVALRDRSVTPLAPVSTLPNPVSVPNPMAMELVAAQGTNKLSDPNAGEDASWLTAIMPSPCHKSEERWLKSANGIVVPPGSLGFIAAVTNGKVEGDPLVHRAHSSQPGREWVVPNCVLPVCEELVHVPVLNIGRRPLRWVPGNPLATMEVLTSASDTRYRDAVSVAKDAPRSDQSPIDSLLRDVTLGSTLTEQQRSQMMNLLKDNVELFSISSGLVGTVTEVLHTIDSGDAAPISSRHYRVSPG